MNSELEHILRDEIQELQQGIIAWRSGFIKKSKEVRRFQKAMRRKNKIIAALAGKLMGVPKDEDRPVLRP
jgi:hypothetical protein